MFRGRNNKVSMMRVGFFLSIIVGSIVSLAGTIAMFYDLTHAGTAITTGLGLVGSGGWAKAVQAKWEQNDNANAN